VSVLGFFPLLGLILGCASSGSEDPWRAANRPVFAFNDGLDRSLLEPVAEAWHALLPDRVEQSITNVFDNLGMPWVLANDLLQGRPGDSGKDLLRWTVNTTIGIGGIFDCASKLGIPKNDEDFGQTLGVWRVPSGPYMVLPLLGPSTPRHTIGRVFDLAGNPLSYLRNLPLRLTAGAISLLNTRARFLELVRENRDSAIDYYVFIRSAYIQNREREVHGDPPGADQQLDDIYDSDAF
jgi:phospholipid-binding lipoprotein MlaA